MSALGEKLDNARRSMTGFALTSDEAQIVLAMVAELEQHYRKNGHQSTYDLLLMATGKAPAL